MSNTRTRLHKCFADLFPQLTPAQIDQASTENVAEWDSVATVTLLTLIEDEFGIAIDFEDLETLTSFELIAAHLESKTAA